MWPRKPAFRRAARWDGVYPIAIGETADDPTPMTPELLADIVAYVTAHRATDGSFDVAVNGSSFPGTESHSSADFAAAGASRWIENIGWPPGVPLTSWLEFIATGSPD